MTARCFGCHVLLAGESDAMPVRFDALCAGCDGLGPLAAIQRRPVPCDCPHCVHWRRAA